MCSLALTACNDDDSIIDRTGGNNLQVEVSANFHSRAPIHESILPDNNPIGVTLTAKDGSSYDNQNYNNIPYSATTADGKQTWVPQDKPVTLSVTEGVAMAYWPYNADAADMTAVPVETDTQTDYMYSGNVTGLTNATPKAAFQMKHAMTLIRINVVRGTYTAEGAVTAVTAASEAFCTSGTMNVSTGALADLKGAETPFLEEPADAAITTAGRVTEFLVLPDVTVDAASVALGVTVDGRKYSTAIEVSEAYKQGYIYTYNLTLDNTALNVSAVAVTPWEEEISVEAPEPVAEEDQYIVQVTIDSDNYTYKHNIRNFKGTVDWGDGLITEYLEESWPSHSYEKAGKYLVICNGTAKAISVSYNAYQSSCDISRIIKIGGDMGISSMESAFRNMTKLVGEIPAGLFDELKDVTDIRNCFADCKGLTGPIPGGLFDNMLNLKDVESCFLKCSGLTTIPDGLFKNNSKIKTFNFVFKECKGLKSAIPAGLFDNCPDVTSFGSTFQGCSGLTGPIPAGLFDNNTKVTNFTNTFNGCSGLTGSIPTELFDKCTEVSDFGAMFAGCTGITSIPEGLFDKCSKATKFNSTFQGCSGLTNIPAGLFDYNLEVKEFTYTFAGCETIKGIPTGLFDNNTKVTSFNHTFYNTGIVEIPAGLFDKCTEVTTFAGTFRGCKKLINIPEKLFDYNTEVTMFRNTFDGCSALTAIPDGLFDCNIKVTNFNATFFGCTALTIIPAGLFDNCTEVIQFGWDDESGCFAKSGVTQIPQGLFDYNTKVTSFAHVFDWCSSLTGEIPEGLFDNCPEVTTFQRCFYLTKIPSIPINIFDKNTKVTNFKATFANIGTLANGNESPYTIINVDGEDKKVHLYERSLYPEHFIAPTGYSACYGYGSYTHFSDKEAIIAAGWN